MKGKLEIDDAAVDEIIKQSKTETIDKKCAIQINYHDIK